MRARHLPATQEEGELQCLEGGERADGQPAARDQDETEPDGELLGVTSFVDKLSASNRSNI